jgi:hypothetical protein
MKDVSPDFALPNENTPAEGTDTRIAEALAATVKVDIASLGSWAAVVEYETEDGVTVRTLWSAAATPWQVRGLAREMLRHSDAI